MESMKSDRHKMPDRGKRISLHPLKLDEILEAVLKVSASKKPVMPKRLKSKPASKSAS
jgi:hypothetical protein